jgi:histidine ammonia-lyase
MHGQGLLATASVQSAENALQNDPRTARAAAQISQVHEHVRHLVQGSRLSQRSMEAVVDEIALNMDDSSSPLTQGATLRGGDIDVVCIDRWLFAPL